mmetsp:Transcript_42999/g.138175  ORF Transcript_42999/g.138175 Transcript_42999/m.138175 type:complete len:227 (+) Transcript_42999:471-1151(+)
MPGGGGPRGGIMPSGGMPMGGMPGGGIPRGGIPGGGPRGGIMPGGGMPGGGMPIGGMPGGGPRGGIMPGGAMPGGGMPGGGMPGGAPAGRGYICGAAVAAVCGCIAPIAGPPMPRTGPARPAGAVCGAIAMPRPAAFATPGPPSAPATGLRRSSWGGGPSTDMDTTVSPRTSTRPSVRFSSRSSFFPLIVTLRNSSVSDRIRFMYLSKAMNLPTNVRESWMVIRIR